MLHLHAKALKLEEAVRVTETQDAHAGRLARLCRFARDRLGMAPAKVLPAQGPMPIFMQVLFVVDLSTSVGGDTLTNYISTLNVWYKERGLSPPSQHPELAAKLVGIRRAIGEQGGNERKRRTPLTLAPLRLMLRSLDKHAAAAPRGSAERLRCRRDAVATVVGFFGLLRKSELANAKLGELKNCHTHWTLKLPYSKVDQLRRGRTQWFAQRTASDIDIDALLTGYVEMLKNLGFGDNDPLLLNVARSKVTRAHLTFKGRVISEMIKSVLEDVAHEATARGFPIKIDAGGYASHSLRRGGNNHAAKCGHKREMRMVFGRWSSDSVDDYREWDHEARVGFTARM